MSRFWDLPASSAGGSRRGPNVLTAEYCHSSLFLCTCSGGGQVCPEEQGGSHSGHSSEDLNSTPKGQEPSFLLSFSLVGLTVLQKVTSLWSGGLPQLLSHGNESEQTCFKCLAELWHQEKFPRTKKGKRELKPADNRRGFREGAGAVLRYCRSLRRAWIN